MEFLCFKANCGQKYAAKLDDLVAVMQKPVITSIPNAQTDAVVGMFSRFGELIPVVDIAHLYSGHDDPDANFIVILDGYHKFAILVDEINEIMRGDVPTDVRFLDAHDFETSVLTYDHTASSVELF